MNAQGQEIQSTLQQRVGDYLSNSTRKGNSFVAAAEATEAETARVVESDMSEYLLERAIRELRAAQEKVDILKKEVEANRKLK